MLLYRAEGSEFARFGMPQIKRLQRLIYMSRHFLRNDGAKLRIKIETTKKKFSGG